MYCKQCHKKIEKNVINCPYCGFNNSNDIEMGATRELDLRLINGYKEPPNKHKSNPKIVTAVAIVLIIGILVVAYFVNGTKSDDNNNYTSTTTKEIVNTKEFKIDNLTFYYPLEFDVDNNKLYYIQNSQINITFNKINDTEYFDVMNNNEVLDTTLNEIEAKTYANDNNYGYLLDISNNKYHIVINYTDDIEETVQASINKILKSLIIK